MASPSSSPCSPRAAARLLLKGVQRRDPDALRRCRIQFGDLADLTDHDVVTKMGLMRCKLVIERETHAIRTDDLAPAVTDGHVGYPLARNRTPLPTICTWKSSGTLAHIDLWQGGNPNFLVAGIPGCGKTMFVHYLAQQLLQDEGQLFVIDPGQSFASITTLQGERGRQLSIRDAGVLFNPCDGSPTFLAECIEHLVTPPGERVLNANDRKIMESAIKRAFASALHSDAKSKTSTAKPHVVLSDIAHELTDGGPDGHRMALLLQPFCAGGTYGDYLDGPSAYDWSHATVWDFECDQLRHTDKHAYGCGHGMPASRHQPVRTFGSRSAETQDARD